MLQARMLSQQFTALTKYLTAVLSRERLCGVGLYKSSSKDLQMNNFRQKRS